MRNYKQETFSEKISKAKRKTAPEFVPALLGLSEVFGHDLAHNRIFVEAVSQAYQRITRHGARQAVIETLNI